MKKSTTLLDLLKHLVSEEDVQMIVASHGYQDVGRKLPINTLLQFFVIPVRSLFYVIQKGKRGSLCHF
ncbi:hypothetical protein JQN58_12305 [Aneurinibacillus sp. BA2021]|nr:hypothetical protein [Aneurinibacillus sp. BA2021]